jgi:hypothetical protein
MFVILPLSRFLALISMVLSFGLLNLQVTSVLTTLVTLPSSVHRGTRRVHGLRLGDGLGVGGVAEEAQRAGEDEYCEQQRPSAHAASWPLQPGARRGDESRLGVSPVLVHRERPATPAANPEAKAST